MVIAAAWTYSWTMAISDPWFGAGYNLQDSSAFILRFKVERANPLKTFVFLSLFIFQGEPSMG